MPSRKTPKAAAQAPAVPAAQEPSATLAATLAATPMPPMLIDTVRQCVEATGEQIESVVLTEDGNVIVRLKPRGDEKYPEALETTIGGTGAMLANLGADLVTDRLRETFADQRLYAAGTHPDQQEQDDDEAAVEVNITDLGHARALPEVPAGPVLLLDRVAYATGSIEQFADEDGRTMRIVSIGGTLHKYPAPEVAAEAVEG